MDDIGTSIGKTILMALAFVAVIALAAVYCGEYGYQLGTFVASGAQADNSGQRPVPMGVLIRCMATHEPYDQCAQDIPPAEPPAESSQPPQAPPESPPPPPS